MLAEAETCELSNTEGATMAKAGVRFAQVRDVLLDLGFREAPISEQHVGFQHDASDTFLAMPVYKDREIVAPHHLVAVRGMLDQHGVLDAEEFDRRIASATARPSAS